MNLGLRGDGPPLLVDSHEFPRFTGTLKLPKVLDCLKISLIILNFQKEINSINFMRMATIKKGGGTDNNKCWQQHGEIGTIRLSGKVKYNRCEKNSVAVPLKVKNRIRIGCSNSTSGYKPKRTEGRDSDRCLHTHVLNIAMGGRQKAEATQAMLVSFSSL